MYKIVYTSLAQKDAKNLASSNLKKNCVKLLEIIANNPYQDPPPFKKLVGDLTGFLSRRVNIQHRLVYKIYEKEKIIKVLRIMNMFKN